MPISDFKSVIFGDFGDKIQSKESDYKMPVHEAPKNEEVKIMEIDSSAKSTTELL